MKLGIVGSRKLAGNLRAYHVIHEYISALKPDQIVSGGARGVDSMAVEVALGMGYDVGATHDEGSIDIHYPKPRSPKKWDYVAACFIRNSEIAEECDDLLAIMTRGGSKGTLDTVGKVQRREKTVFVIYVD